MADVEQEERTEQATPRRRHKAREKGQVTRSRELAAMAGTAGTLLVFFITGDGFMRNLSHLTSRLLSLQYGTDPVRVMRVAGSETLMLLMPLMLTTMVFGVAASLLQGGMVVKAITFELERLNPFAGLKRLLSKEIVIEFFKNLFKFSVGVAVFYIVIAKATVVLPYTPSLDLQGLQDVSFDFIAMAVLSIFGTFFLIAVVDYLVQRWRFERSIRMTKQEVREEYKEMEGDPMVKSRIKSIQRDLARKRMMQEVPKATVVITNPTHLAVALRYETRRTPAPKVVAKGSGFIAERIRDAARKHGVPIVEDKPLARALFKVEIDTAIPSELYQAVAKILAYIYKLKGAA